MTKLVLTAGPYELDERGELRLKEGVLQILRPFWVSWFEPDCPWRLVTPWWIHGQRQLEGGEEQDIICGAFMGFNDEHVVEQVFAAHNDPEEDIEFAFIEERPLGWTPFHETGMPRRSWMIWDQKPH